MPTRSPAEVFGVAELAVLETAPIAIVICDRTGRPLFANRQAVDLIGRTIDPAGTVEQASTTYGLYVHGTDLLYPVHRRAAIVAARTGVECWVDDMEIRRPDKTVVVEAHAQPMLDDDGSVVNVVTYYTDVTARRNAQAEHALTEALAQAIAAAPTFGDAVQMSLDRICEMTGWTFGQAWLPDPAGVHLRCEYASYATLTGLAEYHAACRQLPLVAGMDLPGRVWLAKEPEWVSDLSPNLQQPHVGNDVLDNFPPGFRHRLAIPVLADGDVVAVFCFFVQARSEHDQRLLDRVVNVVGQVGAWVGARRILDLRAQRVQDALELEHKAVERLDRLYTMSDTVLKTVTHDLRAPIAAVLALTQALLADVAADQPLAPELRVRMLSNVQHGAREMDRLLRDLVDSDPRHALDTTRRGCDVGDIVSRTLQESDLEARHPVHTRIESVRISANAAHVERIAHNLLTNAGKHVAPGVAVWVSVESTHVGVLISVEDAGVGVAPDLAEQIFEPFHRGPAATSDGLGLGLSLVSGFARLHGGRAWVEERVGGGASFRVYLPDGDVAAGARRDG